ncbi:protein LBH isoform X2 [Electrophorus electricus]|nr:protein LBH isoform X2 [Electrophorus electricus]
MTDIITTPEHTRDDLTMGGASEDEGISCQIFPDIHEHYPKLSKHLPSIVVEPSEGDVESGELRWPPDDLRTTDTTSCTHANICSGDITKDAKPTHVTCECKNKDKIQEQDD